ncbi:MAG: tRNA (N6-threonylcarbamoyladenosine(37)-N6)-methyltransferase TrmO [Paludibacteraceae bacterium]|nr:tRNA (N6-threonylcarbamoyladenosine(37)-N6)-methyltransferase TrmO [Paludibacteraceae bacterium]
MLTLQPIAVIHNDLTQKFGIPRQSGMAMHSLSRIVFLPDYRQAEALRGLEGYSHLWMLWHFSEGDTQVWSPTVRPPRLGGNRRMGVFATRSPYRPNPVGLSCVRLERVVLQSADGPYLEVSGADLMNGTPIFDIKPYLPYTDAHPEARGGFGEPEVDKRLQVSVPSAMRPLLSDSQWEALEELLAMDPRPGYQHDDGREYVMAWSGREVRFRVLESENRLQVVSV